MKLSQLTSFQTQKQMPLWKVILLDFLLLALLLGAFCYFHHIRERWVVKMDISHDQKLSYVSDLGNNSPEIDPVTNLDISGLFGRSFPERFLQDGKTILLESDAEIRAYLSDAGFAPSADPDAKYIGLYRSHDIFLTVSEINTKMVYEPANEHLREQYFVYDFYVRNLYNLYSAYSNQPSFLPAMIDEFAEAYGEKAIAAINGDFLGNGNHCKYAVRNGTLIRSTEFTLTDTCAIFSDGTMKTYTPTQFANEFDRRADVYQFWDFGPALLDGNGKALHEFDGSQYGWWVVEHNNPRTGIGYFEPGHYCFVCVDGRSADSDGLRISQFAGIFEGLGCEAAYNLDGGDSSEAYFNGTFQRDHDEDKDSLREIYDIICIGEFRPKGDN